MEDPAFLGWETLEDLHSESLKRHGGLDGIRDRGALESALGAAENTYFYGGGDVHDIGASYAFHVAECQGFIDGNKRTAIACAGTFLLANGCSDKADDQVLYDAMIAIAERRMDKAGLAAVLRLQFPRTA
ncbi:MAG: type II toxin-antitoxin system death-on-curing family toxin [Verrucomicrobia bacterium]|nr:type II toxin-antitoxin system death-on-curing family toxin [Verrucomicrobiota bacterium]